MWLNRRLHSYRDRFINFRTLDLGLFIIVHQTQRNTK
jgi:hypothetical protein